MTNALPPELEPFAYIAASADGTWEPATDEDGTQACLLAVWSDDGQLIDTVAWQFGQPSRWWLRWKNVAYIGEDYIERIITTNAKSVRFVATPRDWLHDAGEAVCVVDWSRPILPLLDQLPGVVCATPALEKRLREKIAAETQSRVRIGRAA